MDYLLLINGFNVGKFIQKLLSLLFTNTPSCIETRPRVKTGSAFKVEACAKRVIVKMIS